MTIVYLTIIYIYIYIYYNLHFVLIGKYNIAIAYNITYGVK